jgi:hypothetical protein
MEKNKSAGNKNSPTGEFLLHDETFEFTEAEHGFHYFFKQQDDRKKKYPDVPENWVSPEDYYNGMWHMRYEIISQPTSAACFLMFGIWADWNFPTSWTETISKWENCTGPGGVYLSSSVPATWWNKDDKKVDFARVKDIFLCGTVIAGGDRRFISDWVAEDTKPSKGSWSERAKYLPMKLRVSIVAVAKNSNFSGWDHYINS